MMWVKDFMDGPKKKLELIMPRLKQLQNRLYEISGHSYHQNPLGAIVQFFGQVSPWHDQDGLKNLIADFKAVNYGQYDQVIKELEKLDEYFVKVGRDLNGTNRSEKGQTVNSRDVFLGKILGLSIKSVSFWELKKHDPKGGWGFGYEAIEHLNSYDVICDQAKWFVESNAREMCQIINRLENYLKK